ncbi:hypothetical protein SAMN05192558_105296 [Actinokineospora alba]|uniref:Uncharacterized protein n=1 Tax=Actinokineospora alba TaxID=504798 RepID=A0A1H0NBZ9_9PSEU|nr:hypothetical protein [Actinokineospora alba]TDP68666.1 hypothetical protein C8E96_4231 [Actinokineospora alba]SDH83982.1 hypothetical protein SAMN05421871_102346 [Actinokineospora alba]SDO90242.1 hypothetical protein SAMN05192558_105296 [Actinokineospora alba]
MNEDRQPRDESEDPLPEAADPLDDFTESGTRDVRIEGRTARATDDLDEAPKPDKNVQEPPD